MIENYTWPLGTLENSFVTRQVMFENERKNRVMFENQSTWIGKIGLIHVSDYAYASNGNSSCTRKELSSWANDDCAKKSWLLHGSQWTLTINDGRSYVNYIGSTGYVYSFDYFVNGVEVATSRDASNSFFYAPVLYLKETVKIKGGTGTRDEPYILTM